MSHPNEPLKVDPVELRMSADRLETQGNAFQAAHQAAHSRAGRAALGSGASAAALPGMLAAWEDDAARFGELFAKHAQGHREAADSYVATDADSAERIDDASSSP